MIKVITFGVFDLLHYGHINLFKRSKELGDYLIVAVQTDADAQLNKPDIKLVNNITQRLSDVNSVKYVDQSIVYSQIDEAISSVNFDILVIGPDQTNSHFKKALKWCNENNKKVVVLPRTDGISSSILRKAKI